MKPNYLLIGTPKAGTTSFCALLEAHPDVFMFPPKEARFFNDFYDRGTDWYESLFAKARGYKAIGEGTPAYTRWHRSRDAAERIAAYNPDMRLIFMARNPIDRIESQYVQLLDIGWSLESLEDAILNSAPGLIATSCYWERISDYRRHFPDEQIHVLFFEDFRADPRPLMRDAFAFLGVDPDFEIPLDERSRRNSRETKTTDRWYMQWLRRQPWYTRANWALPRGLVQRIKPLFRRPITAHVEWTEDLLNYTIEKIEPDARTFLNFYGKPPNFWDLKGDRSISR